MPRKARKAVAALFGGLSRFGAETVTGSLDLISHIPRGRGYASSTADVGATLYALAHAVGYDLKSHDVARLAVTVEPSDSTLFPGLCLFAHRDARLRVPLGAAPPLAVIVLDPGGEVDTLAFNALDHDDVLQRLAPRHERAFRLLRDALRQRDWEALGHAATLSSRAHQAILPDPMLETALDLVPEVRALGVCRAHSGTILGLLMDPQEEDITAAAHRVRQLLPRTVSVAPYRLVGGGPRPGCARPSAAVQASAWSLRTHELSACRRETQLSAV